ncbi:hypothetical protein DdX_04334 [Ditylenchus destructor]|uniref:Uncharacterized protein n=1 Tax=Ditylenchus destructor TaxID=166010 RepID=A0AAD4NEC8_9BILA|nr:hypothetical protein DdX_04334 [Ditylenchus destructor]
MNTSAITSKDTPTQEAPLILLSPCAPVMRLQLDSEGNARCPVCDENIGSQPSQWSAHLEVERAKLIKAIESVKDEHFGSRMSDDGLQSSATAHQTAHRKREQELVRIRANQQKRFESQN